MIALRYITLITWTEPVLDNFNRFLQDHAAAEKSLVSGESGLRVSQPAGTGE